MGLLFGGSTAIFILSLISLAFLIIASLTPPVSSGFGLAEYDNIIYGALGYFNIETNSFTIGKPFYSIDDLTNSSNNDWKFDSNIRDKLVKFLIVIPIAGFLTLLNLFVNFLAHFKSIGYSKISNIFNLFISLLAFLSSGIAIVITFLLFYPHIKWPSWLLIPASVFNLINIPLSFFVLKVNSDYNDNNDDDQDFDENDQFVGNLTDLTVNDEFKHINNFPNNNINNDSISNKSNHLISTKILTHDSNSINEKISLNDYSKDYNNGNKFNNNYKQSNRIFEEGSANLIPSQNYAQKTNEAVTESPTFEPQSIDIESNNNIHNNHGLKNNNSSPTIPNLEPSNDLNPNKSSSIYNSPPVIISNNNNNNGSNINEYDFESNDYGNDNGIDTGSDFTSISQRPANYYQPFNQQQNGLNKQKLQQIQPQSQQQQQQQQYQPQSQLQQQQYQPQSQLQQQQYQPQPHQPYQAQHYQPQIQPQQYQPQQYQLQPQQYQPQHYQLQPQPQQFHAQPQQPQPPTQQQAPRKDTSAILLNANPDFQVNGPAFQKPNGNKKPLQQQLSGGGYKPAYKRGQANAKNLVAASSHSDSPYNFR
ncbi:hypothetical protein WICMUC_004571 [Wickerhamomyces mucosus]|uniref:Pali-domain-containing protein n=1 Tax=Wickerhamomyces mucosus TaxID=1378264 RepID=A0A9P8TAX4_9ASCO|nr:hypothetical protein WICMUC_004571 [Wickerhamomyces mucosus]